MGEIDRPQPDQLRISDADRHQVAEILREAAGEGRIDLEELDERLELAYAARTYADLVPITADLPVAGRTAMPLAGPAPGPATPVVPGGIASDRGVAIMSGFERRGDWLVPQQLTVLCLMGGAEIDLRVARFSAREVVITVNAVMGGAQITVNPATRVIVEGVGIMGGFAGPRSTGLEEYDASSPTVRVRGFALMGGVSVERRPLPGRGALRRRRDR